MESTRTKVELAKPVILKAGIPLAISVAGFIFARITARNKSSASTASHHKIQVNSLEITSQEVRDDGDDHECLQSLTSSTSLPLMEDGNHFLTDTHYMNSMECNEQVEDELSSLRCRIEELQDREKELELQFLRYCDLKDQQSALVEFRYILLLEMAHVESLHKEISLMSAENTRLEDLVVEYLNILQQLKFSRMENGLLQKKVKKLMRKSKAQSRAIREQNLQIEDGEAEILGNRRELQIKADVIKEMEDEIRELNMNLNQLQLEKKELVNKLELAEGSASTKTEAEGIITREDHDQVVNELQLLQKDQAAEVKEMISLRWCNACLRHKLMRRNQEQAEEENNLEIDFAGMGETGDLGSEHELNGEDGEPCLGVATAHHSKKPKLIEKLKRWVEGSEKRKPKSDEKDKQHIKRFGRHSGSDVGGEHHFPARKSCSSA